MTESFFSDLQKELDKTVVAFRKDLAKVRTGRASTALLEGVMVDYYGSATPLNQLGSLSARELEIFRHLAEGSSAAEIAVRLSRSSKTINNQRTRILHKLGVKNATELVRLALQSGLVSV